MLQAFSLGGGAGTSFASSFSFRSTATDADADADPDADPPAGDVDDDVTADVDDGDAPAPTPVEGDFGDLGDLEGRSKTSSSLKALSLRTRAEPTPGGGATGRMPFPELELESFRSRRPPD